MRLHGGVGPAAAGNNNTLGDIGRPSETMTAITKARFDQLEIVLGELSSDVRHLQADVQHLEAAGNAARAESRLLQLQLNAELHQSGKRLDVVEDHVGSLEAKELNSGPEAVEESSPSIHRSRLERGKKRGG